MKRITSLTAHCATELQNPRYALSICTRKTAAQPVLRVNTMRHNEKLKNMRKEVLFWGRLLVNC